MEGMDEEEAMFVDDGPAPWDEPCALVHAISPAKGTKRAAHEHEADVTPPSKKGKMTKAQAVLSSKKKSGKFVAFCPGCLLWFRASDIAGGMRLDFKCKSVIDRIWYVAKTQGKLEWYKAIRHDDQKLFQVITTFKDKVPDFDDGRTRKVPAGACWQFLEKIVLKTIILRDVEGMFMYEREYYAFAETYPGGKLSEEQAKLKWLQWKANAEDPDMRFPPTDMDGPDQSKFRMWVKTATKMHYQEAEERTKELMLQEKPRKDCTPAEIDAMQKRLASNHDTVAGTSAQRPEEIAAHMAANGHGGIGGAFQGPVADLGDVTQLAPGDHEGQDDEEEEDEEEEDDVDPAEDTGLVHKKSSEAQSRAKWFDWDKAVQAFVRGDGQGIERLRGVVEKTVGEMDALLKQIDDKYSHLKPLMAKEQHLCKSRADFLRLTLLDTDDADEQLKAAIEKVKAEQELMSNPDVKGKAAGKKGKGSNKGKQKGLMSKGPPCLTYQHVLTVKFLKQGVDSFYESESRADMLAVQMSNRAARRPVTDLNSSCTSTARSLKLVLESLIANQGNGKGKGGKGTKKGGGTGRGAKVTPIMVMQRPGAALFEYAPAAENICDIKCLDAGKCKSLNLAAFSSEYALEPLIVRLDFDHFAVFKQDAVNDNFKEFTSDFTASQERATKGRGARKILAESDVHTQVSDVFKSIFPEGCWLRDDCMDNLVGPYWFGLLKDNISSSMEPDTLAAMRLVLTGRREVICAKLSDMLDFMKTSGVSPEFVTPSRSWGFFKAMEQDPINEFFKAHRLHHGTVQPHELLYVPSGWIIAEKTSSADVHGVAMRGVVPFDFEMKTKINVMKEYAKAGAEASRFEKLLEAVTKLCDDAEPKRAEAQAAQEKKDAAEKKQEDTS